MSTPPPSRSLYIPAGEDEASFGVFHPTGAPGKAAAALLCPPFGWEELCSYRCRRRWAEELAARGHPALRIDLPASGDSPGSPRDRGRLEAWTAGVASSAEWLRAETGCERLAAVGLSLGGLIAVRAAAAGARIDDLVLWSVPSRGRRLVRELRAFAALYGPDFDPVYADEDADVEPTELADGSLEVNGFLLSAETVAGLEAVALEQAELPELPGRRALLLERDGIAPDRRLKNWLERSGVPVTLEPGAGFSAMMAHPEKAEPPMAEIEAVGHWLAGTPAGAIESSPPGPPPRTLGSIEVESDGVVLSERPFTVGCPAGELRGILAEPSAGSAAPLTAILLNAGALRRIGQGRLWVDLARRAAASGVSALRIDLEGIGDADGETTPYADVGNFYTTELVEQVIATMDEAEAAGLPARFVLTGLCSGAYWTFHAALRDDRVTSAFMFNPRAIHWDPELERERAVRRMRQVSDRNSWRRLLRGEIKMSAITRTIRDARAAPHSGAAAARNRMIGESFERLDAAGRRALLVFGRREPLCAELEECRELERIAARPTAEVERLSSTDHTLRPLEAQRHAAEIFAGKLAKEVERAR